MTKGRRLSKQNDMNVDNVPTVMGACCILHNVCQIQGNLPYIFPKETKGIRASSHGS